MPRDVKALSTPKLMRLLVTLQGDDLREVVGEVVARYERPLYTRIQARVGWDSGLADEVFQETFVRLLKWLKTRRRREPIRSLPGLLMKFADYAGRDLRGRRAQTPSALLNPEDQIQPSLVPDIESILYVQEILENLDPLSREVLRRIYWEGLNSQEVANQINESALFPNRSLSSDGVRKIHERARALLRRQIERDDLASFIEPL